MKKPFQKTSNLIHIFNQLKSFIKPYKWMVFGTLALTSIGALFAQVNPIVLKYTVDEVTKLTQLPHPMSEGIHVLILISIILLAKELANIFIQFGPEILCRKN